MLTKFTPHPKSQIAIIFTSPVTFSVKGRKAQKESFRSSSTVILIRTIKISILDVLESTQTCTYQESKSCVLLIRSRLDNICYEEQNNKNH